MGTLLSRNVECGNDGDYGKTGVGAHALLSQRVLALAQPPRRVNIPPFPPFFFFFSTGAAALHRGGSQMADFLLNISLIFSMLNAFKVCCCQKGEKEKGNSGNDGRGKNVMWNDGMQPDGAVKTRLPCRWRSLTSCSITLIRLQTHVHGRNLGI